MRFIWFLIHHLDKMHFLGDWSPLRGAVAAIILSSVARAITFDINDERTWWSSDPPFMSITEGNEKLTFEFITESIKDAASTSSYAMMKYYYGNETGQIPGAFPDKWWEGAPLLMALLEYWHFTGDTTYNEELSVALQWQSGTSGDYMPSNYSSYLVSTVRVWAMNNI